MTPIVSNQETLPAFSQLHMELVKTIASKATLSIFKEFQSEKESIQVLKGKVDTLEGLQYKLADAKSTELRHKIFSVLWASLIILGVLANVAAFLIPPVSIPLVIIIPALVLLKFWLVNCLIDRDYEQDKNKTLIYKFLALLAGPFYNIYCEWKEVGLINTKVTEQEKAVIHQFKELAQLLLASDIQVKLGQEIHQLQEDLQNAHELVSPNPNILLKEFIEWKNSQIRAIETKIADHQNVLNQVQEMLAISQIPMEQIFEKIA